MQSDIATQRRAGAGRALGAGEEKRLSEKPTQNLAAYDAFLQGRRRLEEDGGSTDPVSLRKALAFYEQAVALDPVSRGLGGALARAKSLLYANGVPTPELAERAREAAEKAVALAPGPAGRILGARRLQAPGRQRSAAGALEQYTKGAAPCARQRGSPAGDGAGGAEPRDAGRRRSNSFGKPSASIPGRSRSRAARHRADRPAALSGGARGLRPRARARARQPESDRTRAMTFLGEGDLAGARNASRPRPKRSIPPTIVAYVANFYDLVWAPGRASSVSCSCA